MNLFQKWQPTIYENLKEIISSEKTSTAWNHEILDELFQFCVGGKCIRGGLFLSLFEILECPLQDIHFKISASIELTHSSLLIHDDIIDGDTKRRNEPTMHCRFQPKSFGNAVAICAGDIGFWISCKYIALLENSLMIFSYKR